MGEVGKLLDAREEMNTHDKRRVPEVNAEFEEVCLSTDDERAQTNNQIPFLAATRGCREERLQSRRTAVMSDSAGGGLPPPRSLLQIPKVMYTYHRMAG
jgi:hypothetical protein